MWNGSEMIMYISPFGLAGVQIEYYKRGFQRPVDGDQAKIDVHVSLPCAPGSDDLADEYIWGDEIVLFGKPLNPDWGKMIAKGKRTVIFTAMGSTFAEAFEGAENDVAVMLMPLADAMDARKERMRAADWRP